MIGILATAEDGKSRPELGKHHQPEHTSECVCQAEGRRLWTRESAARVQRSSGKLGLLASCQALQWDAMSQYATQACFSGQPPAEQRCAQSSGNAQAKARHSWCMQA